MPSKAEIARLADEQRRAARRDAIAAELRDRAQAEYDALVEQQRQLVEGHAALQQELDHSAASAAAAHQHASEVHAEATRVLAGAQADVDAVATRRREATDAHIATVREMSSRIAELAPKLTADAWLEAASAQVATESSV